MTHEEAYADLQAKVGELMDDLKTLALSKLEHLSKSGAYIANDHLEASGPWVTPTEFHLCIWQGGHLAARASAAHENEGVEAHCRQLLLDDVTMGSNLGHGAFIAPTTDDIILCWGSVITLERTGFQIQAEALSKVLQAYERIAQLIPYKESK